MTPDTNVQYIDALRLQPQPIPGHVDVVMSVPLATLDKAWVRRNNFMNDEIVFESWLSESRSEKDLQLLLAVFWAAADALPMLSHDYANWVLDYGCPNTVRAALENYFQSASEKPTPASVDPRAELLSAVRTFADLIEEDQAQGEHQATYVDMVVEGLWNGLGANLTRLQQFHDKLGTLLETEGATASAA